MAFLQSPLLDFNVSSLVTAAMKLSQSLSSAMLLGTATSQSYSPNVLDLSTVNWTLSSPQNSSINVPGNVPSQAHLDLFAAGLIPDPYFGLGDFELRWVTYLNWTYEAELGDL
jgi:beta-mannosidase